jgi:hypothetical protein
MTKIAMTNVAAAADVDVSITPQGHVRFTVSDGFQTIDVMTNRSSALKVASRIKGQISAWDLNFLETLEAQGNLTPAQASRLDRKREARRVLAERREATAAARQSASGSAGKKAKA